ncbi:MAG: iron-sulfur cluster-binding domain-containing protein [Clostridia bacterium]|nr:iron-sulfur cluster-binding domain-containing protein [Clostridia bacterium]
MALNVKVGMIGKLDMLKFKNQPKARRKAIEAGSSAPLPKTLRSNEKAKFMHPEKLVVKIAEIIPQAAGAKTIVFETPDGSPFPPFRAGQYISVALEIGTTKTTRPYSLCLSPECAIESGRYAITVKRDDTGFVSKHILDNFKAGQMVAISGPQGNLYYEPIRDRKNVLGLAGGSGITPFMGMARAIRDGIEDFDLTIIFGSRFESDIVLKEELDEVCAACSKVHVVHVLSDEERAGYEHGFITAELIKKYSAGKPFSVFMCGPQAMYNFLDGEIEKLGLDQKTVRRELFGSIKDPWNYPGYPMEAKDKVFSAKVRSCGKEYEIPVLANEPLLVAVERAGIPAPSRCRSGECGWCRSKLLSGNVFIPEITDGRRAADIDFGYIHPCSSFALSDVTLEVPGEYMT